VFTTSGAETVEAAIKLVRVKTGRLIILSCEGSYHGKTMGAMAVSGRDLHAELFGPRAPGFAHVPFGDADALETFLVRHGTQVAALFVEPIQGERGVFFPPDGYLRRARELCTHYGVALVLDEIQTGLGRTGRLFCCEHEGVVPDLMLLSKAVGGGLFPLGVCLVTTAFWDSRFALTHSATFANNNIACRVGLAVIQALTQDGLCAQVACKGEQLLSGLRRLAARYPGTIAAVRGRGLLCALQLQPVGADGGLFRSYLYHQGLYAYSVASMLAERESILVLPALGDTNILRITPPLIISEAQIDMVLKGLDAVCALIECGATDAMVSALGGLDHEPVPMRGHEAPIVLPPVRPRQVDGPTYAFLMHYTRPEDVVLTDPALACLSPEQLQRYCAFISQMPPGVVLEAPPLHSITGAVVRGWLIALGMLPEEMFRRGRAGVSSEIARALDLAATLGAHVIGLGAFTTLFSRYGADVVGRGPVVTTGNVLTAAMAFAALKRVAERRGLALTDAAVGVVGARGSIGSLCAKLLARAQVRSMVLVGNATSGASPLQPLCDTLKALNAGPIELTTDLGRLRACDIVLSATSSLRPVLDDAPLRVGTIVCDVAKPCDASEQLRSRPEITVIDGGLVALPDPTIRFGVGNIQGCPTGVQLACLSETILLALAGASRNMGIGNELSLDEVDYLTALATLHGFTLAEPPLDALDGPPDTVPSACLMTASSYTGES
jgi:acetylornithine/succinyldiaminopimelate/putrescine aminotransferase/predicted amino acid dehydrogenase